ncbi:hypothetical protein ELI25_29650 (plasmid) [Rhizobium ruizarguesonis]|uniref:hypothetical protein n=1 Tax=Rhizobium ruizarguesonis TaxID=2081791 RepID=UPI001031F3D9|nr:hypothetical protein [Rhizobium ruizarguesonis]TAW06632.1 hypothetical protein ELI25_29650 [Rhizobium ruizarguesonis]
MAFKAFDFILEPDPRFAELYIVNEQQFRRLTLEDHHSSLYRIGLRGIAPAEVRNAFDRARSVMLYAFFDYELLVVGEVQAIGAFELALKHQLNGHGGRSRSTLRNLVDQARKAGVLPRQVSWGQSRLDAFDALIEIRNALSHGTSDIHTPGIALPILEMCAQWIDHVYPQPP